jgi:hypothetical protein
LKNARPVKQDRAGFSQSYQKLWKKKAVFQGAASKNPCFG